MLPVRLAICGLVLLLICGCDDISMQLTVNGNTSTKFTRIDSSVGQLAISTGLSGFSDPSRQLTLTDVSRHPEQYPFAPLTSPVAISGPSAYIMRLSLLNAGTQPLPVLLEIDHPFLEGLTALLLTEQGLSTPIGPVSQRTPQRLRPYPHRNFVLPLRLPAGQPATLWLRLVKSPGAHAFPLSLWQPAVFVRYTTADTGFWSVLIGWMLFAIVLSSLLAAGTTDSVYWLYGLYVLAHATTIIVHEGLFSDIYAAGVPGLAPDYVGDVAVGVVTGSSILFISALLSSRQYIPPWLWLAVRLWLVAWGIWLSGYFLDSVMQSTHAITLSGKVLYTAKLLIHQTGGVLVMLLIGYGLAQRPYRRLAQTYVLAFVPLFSLALFDFYANLSPVPVMLLMQTPIYAGAILFETLVLTYGLVYRFRTHRNEHERLLREQNELTLRIQLGERERLARDLHDHIGPDMVVLKMQLEAFREASVPVAGKPVLPLAISSIIQQANRIIMDLRQVSHALMPLALGELGLIGALEAFIQPLNNGGQPPDIKFSHNLSNTLSSQQRQYLLQIIKELINNSLRHAMASLIDVAIYQYGQQVDVTVSDDGVGYTPVTGRMPSAGIGLRNVHDLVAGLGGYVDIRPGPAGGMIHRITIPL